MRHPSLRLLGKGVVALALAIGPTSAAGVAAQGEDGALTVRAVPGAAVDKDGTVVLRAKYACHQYEAPFDGSDILVVSITATNGGYDTLTAATCDGTEQHLSVTLAAFDGGASGWASLQLGHEGVSSDGSVATISAFVETPIRIVTAGPR